MTIFSQLTASQHTLIRETTLVTVANLVVALAVNLLAWQFKLVSGGLTGYALFLNLLSGVSIGSILMALNIFLIILAFVLAGKGPGIRSVYGFVSLSFFLDLSRSLLGLQQTPLPSFFLNLLVIVVLSVVMAVAISVVLANNYSVGAYSTLYIIVKKYIDLPAQNLFFFLDFVLAALTGMYFGADKGMILVINAVVAYYVVKLVLPKMQGYFDSLT